MNGRRRWRKWAKKQRAFVRRQSGETPVTVFGKYIKCSPDFYQGWILSLTDDTGQRPPVPRPAFAARSLVGMSQSARKRRNRNDPYRVGKEVRHRMRLDPTLNEVELILTIFAERKAKLRIGERLRPCACGACAPDKAPHSVRAYIMQPWGWPRPSNDAFAHVDIPDMTPCLIFLQGTCALIEYYQGAKKRTATIERRYVSMEPVRICTGDGLLPARKARKVRR